MTLLKHGIERIEKQSSADKIMTITWKLCD